MIILPIISHIHHREQIYHNMVTSSILAEPCSSIAFAAKYQKERLSLELVCRSPVRWRQSGPHYLFVLICVIRCCGNQVLEAVAQTQLIQEEHSWTQVGARRATYSIRPDSEKQEMQPNNWEQMVIKQNNLSAFQKKKKTRNQNRELGFQGVESSLTLLHLLLITMQNLCQGQTCIPSLSIHIMHQRFELATF